MEPAPQGCVVVLSIPAGAGRRGRVDPYDWDEITEYCRRHPLTILKADDVAYGKVGDLRRTYPECRFASFNVHQQVPAKPASKSKEVCTVFVWWTGAGDDEASTD